MTVTLASENEAWRIPNHLLCKTCNNLNDSDNERLVKHPSSAQLAIHSEESKEDLVAQMWMHHRRRKRLQEGRWARPSALNLMTFKT